MKKLILSVIILLMFSSIADARWRLFKRTSRSMFISTAPKAWHDADDQGKCLIEAQYRHDNNIRGHVFGLIGNFEGVGWTGPDGLTCKPTDRKWKRRLGNKEMVKTGDACVGNKRVCSLRYSE